jgi:hypothetical protein
VAPAVVARCPTPSAIWCCRTGQVHCRVEEGNDDGKFTDYAAENEIPITLLATIADAMTVLKDLFAPVAQ